MLGPYVGNNWRTINSTVQYPKCKCFKTAQRNKRIVQQVSLQASRLSHLLYMTYVKWKKEMCNYLVQADSVGRLYSIFTELNLTGWITCYIWHVCFTWLCFAMQFKQRYIQIVWFLHGFTLITGACSVWSEMTSLMVRQAVTVIRHKMYYFNAGHSTDQTSEPSSVEVWSRQPLVRF